VFQVNEATGDARISGTAAALCGVEQALELGDEALLAQALKRLVLLYGVVFSYGGIPLVYMGDELALGNDRSFLDAPATADDNRWLHRPHMDWEAAARRNQPGSVEGRAFPAFARLARARRSLPALHGDASVRLLDTDNPRVLAYVRERAAFGRVLVLAGFSDVAESCSAGVISDAGLVRAVPVLSENGSVELDGDRVALPPLGLVWLVDG
jgi:amylosucrase